MVQVCAEGIFTLKGSLMRKKFERRDVDVAKSREMIVAESSRFKDLLSTKLLSLVSEEVDALTAMLLEKNEAYGNSALDPIRLFSSVDTVEQIRVRIDDKISRIIWGHDYAGDDNPSDIEGYFILLRVALRMQAALEEKED